MQKEHKFLPLVIALVAGLVVSIRMILNRDNSISSIIIVLAVMLGFYIIGLIFRFVLIKLATPKEENEAEDRQDNDELENVATDGETTQEES